MTGSRGQRLTEKRDFLAQSGWAGAQISHLAGDASNRRYDRVALPGRTAVLMDAPPGCGEDLEPFLTIAAWLAKAGISAPEVLSRDLARGFLLLEDLGDDLFSRLCQRAPEREADLYRAATGVLLHLHRQPPPPGLPDLTAQDWAEAAAMALDWYAFAITGERPDPAPFVRALAEALHRCADGPRVVILRDYHAENLLWLPGRAGLARVGVLDFQMAQMGQPAYDLVSLLEDARRDIAPKTLHSCHRLFAEKTGQPMAQLTDGLAVLGAQRALRILGIFARLCLRGGKAHYLAHAPRVWGQLQAALARSPALGDLAGICQRLLPPPSPENLERIASQCRRFP